MVAEAGGIHTGLRIEGTSGLAVAASLHLGGRHAELCWRARMLIPEVARRHSGVEPLRLVDGMLEVPLGAGLGIEVDRDKIERYQVVR